MDTGEVIISKSLDLIEEMIEYGVPVDNKGIPLLRHTVYITNREHEYRVTRHRNKWN
mgnify:FL=1